MIEPLNWKIISHPMNWVVILLMLIIAAAFGHLALSYFGVNPASKDTTSSYTQLPAGQSKQTTQQMVDNPSYTSADYSQFG
jgi:hypothetical protein